MAFQVTTLVFVVTIISSAIAGVVLARHYLTYELDQITLRVDRKFTGNVDMVVQSTCLLKRTSISQSVKTFINTSVPINQSVTVRINQTLGIKPSDVSVIWKK